MYRVVATYLACTGRHIQSGIYLSLPPWARVGLIHSFVNKCVSQSIPPCVRVGLCFTLLSKTENKAQPPYRAVGGPGSRTY